MPIQLHHITVAVICGALFLFVPFTSAFFISLFLVWLAFRLDSRIIAGVAIAFLIAIPILLSFEQEARAERIAVFAYFLLAITVALQIVEFKREGTRKQKSTMIPKTVVSVPQKSSRIRKAPIRPSLTSSLPLENAQGKPPTAKVRPPHRAQSKVRSVDMILPKKFVRAEHKVPAS